MKRFHIHVFVENLDQSIQFYSTLFGSSPARVEADYAKWMLDDPCMNVAISTHRQPVGVNHLGFQQLVARADQDSRETSIHRLVLLTETAERFFNHLGCALIDRLSVGDAVKQSAEFWSLCPAPAVCMTKSLN